MKLGTLISKIENKIQKFKIAAKPQQFKTQNSKLKTQ